MPQKHVASLRLLPLLTGFGVVVLFIRYLSVYGFYAKFGGHLYARKLSYIAMDEFRLWTAFLLLGIPGCMAIFYGVAPQLEKWFERLLAALSRVKGQVAALVGALLAITLLILYQVGNGVLLLGHVITDDEYGVFFGAKMWLQGHLMVPTPQPVEAFQTIFTIQRDGHIASMDWPGVLAFATAALGTGLGPILYSLASALTGLLVVAAAYRLFLVRGALLAAVIWLVSPMALTLSFTTHGHVPSRLCVAAALWAYAHLLEAAPERRLRWGITLGLSAGFGFTARPIEVATLLAPVGAYVLYLALVRPREFARPMLGAIAGTLGPMLLFGLYNSALTGSFLTPPRHSGLAFANKLEVKTPFVRTGSHLGHNLLMLALWFWGPLGLAFSWLGLKRRPPFTAVIGVGFLLGLAVTLAHDNVGIHMVGPIHYSESAVPLTLLATAGLLRVADYLDGLNLHPAKLLTFVSGYAAALLLFFFSYAPSLRAQASFVNTPSAVVAASGIHNAIVLADPPAIRERWEAGLVGSWALGIPHPDPYLRDDVLFAHFQANVDALREQFPKRGLFRLQYTKKGPRLWAINEASHAPPQ